MSPTLSSWAETIVTSLPDKVKSLLAPSVKPIPLSRTIIESAKGVKVKVNVLLGMAGTTNLSVLYAGLEAILFAVIII